MLKNIEIVKTDEAITSIVVKEPSALVAEAEARTHKVGPKTYLDKFIAGKTRLRRKATWWPEEKKVEVCALFASGVSNASDLERLTGIKSATIRSWKTEDWWLEMLEKIHATHDQDTISTFTKVVDQALEVVQDRLINGDFVITKYGEVHRKPVSMKDAVHATSTIVDKRQLLRGKPTSRSESIPTDTRLKKLSEEFKRFAEAKEIKHEG